MRLEWTRGPEVMFLAHLDLSRAMERAVRRAGLPVSLTRGFNPHPRMAFAAPLPVGVTGRCEVLEMWLDEPVGGDRLVAALNGVLPGGLRAVRAREVPGEGASLMSLVNAARYRIAFEPCERDGRWERLEPGGQVEREVDRLMSRPEITVTRRRPGKDDRDVNIRPLLAEITHRGSLRFDVLAGIGSGGNVRPREIICVLASAVDEGLGGQPWSAERVETGRLSGRRFTPAWDL